MYSVTSKKHIQRKLVVVMETVLKQREHIRKQGKLFCLLFLLLPVIEAILMREFAVILSNFDRNPE